MTKAQLPNSIAPDNPQYVVFKKTWWTMHTDRLPEEKQKIINSISEAVMATPEEGQLAELYIQMIKYHKELKPWGGKRFCEYLGLDFDFWSDFEIAMMIAPRLFEASLNDKVL